MQYNHSNKISAFDAKTNFSRLLRRVKDGEKITILKHNVPVALIIPMPTKQKLDIQEVIDSINKFHKGKKLNGLSIEELKNERRR